jgi:hypothetical protein
LRNGGRKTKYVNPTRNKGNNNDWISTKKRINSVCR